MISAGQPVKAAQANSVHIQVDLIQPVISAGQPVKAEQANSVHKQVD